MKTTKNYSGKYTLIQGDKKYTIEKINFGYGDEWAVFEIVYSEVYGENKEWCNTYKTKKQAVNSFNNI